MSKNRSSFLKRDREARKREKQVMKQQRKEDRKRGDLPETDSQAFDDMGNPIENTSEGSAPEDTAS